MAIGVVIVTHNSSRFMERTLSCIRQQDEATTDIVVVDSGSSDVNVLKSICDRHSSKLIASKENIGFCAGNNLGAAEFLATHEFLVFVNPDCFLCPGFLAGAVKFMKTAGNEQIGALTGTLLGFDFDKNGPTERYDSTGIFCTWFGKWYDRDQGSVVTPTRSADAPEDVPAICAALMFCRSSALKSVLLREREVFDETFFMYKEDIDLSRRLVRAGWSLAWVPGLSAHHCRGWNPDRSRMPRRFRWMSARNELRVQWRERSLCVLYSGLKCIAVGLLNR